MITEDERWRTQFSDERNGDREGYRPPYKREPSRSFNGNEGRPNRRPRIQRQGYEPVGRPHSGGNNYGRPYEGGRPSYNREGDNRSYNHDGGYRRQESGYRPRREDGYGQRPEGDYRSRNHFGQHREGDYRRESTNYRPRNNYGQQRPYRPRTTDYDPHAKYSMKKRIEYKERNYDPNEPIRLNKFLANAGVCSRREADDFIQAGVIRVNGQVVTELGTKVLRSDSVLFHDQLITPEKKVYVLLNKPKNCVTTSDDPQNRKTVMDLVKGICKERIYPVGRLDRNTTGVILLTNDGELASKLTHPQYLKKKIYHVHLDKNLTAADLKQIAEGVELEDGPIRPDAVDYASETDKKQVGIEIHSGRNRIVRRIFEHMGYRVMKLDRVYFAGLTKKNVRRGDWRFLTESEVNMLQMGAFE